MYKDIVWQVTMYANEVTLKAQSIQRAHFVQLNKLHQIAHLISDFALRNTDIIPIGIQDEFVEMSNSIVELNEKNMNNFAEINEFQKWNIERLDAVISHMKSLT